MESLNLNYLILAVALILIVIKVDFNAVIDGVFNNKISLNRTIVLALIVLGIYGVYIGYKEAYLSVISGLLAMSQSQNKDGKNGGK
jgi:hypothetical protein